MMYSQYNQILVSDKLSTADLKLTKGVVPVADSFIGGAPTFNITAGSGLAATITSPGNNFAGIVTTGNYISYPGGNNDLNLNRVNICF